MTDARGSRDAISAPLVLDLFCGAGGAGEGYRRAGFRVVGVDIEPQPRYRGHDFVQMDALEFLRRLLDGETVAGYRLEDFVAVHASPPCQNSSKLKALHRDREHPELIPPTRDLVQRTGLPYVIENVVGAKLDNPIMLCGSAFGLGVRRHRLFEASFPMMSPGCAHGSQPNPVPVHGHTGKGANRGRERELGRDNGVADWRAAMDIEGMTAAELAQAIPPAFTEHVGAYLLDYACVA